MSEQRICTKCGKELPSTVVVNTSRLTIAEYVTWKEEDTGLCLGCWRKKDE